MAQEATQTITGKAFEYALLEAFQERLSPLVAVSVLENEPFRAAKACFWRFSQTEKGLYKLHASFAINFLMELEPRLSHGIGKNDVLQLEIVSDKRGQAGDVRDVLAIRAMQKWEIGVSAKNNHRAVKHSRLSNDIDFGEKWLGTPCSRDYFSEISPVFNWLSEVRETSRASRKWSEIGDYHSSVYVPILNAFSKELLRLDKEHPGVVARRLVEYLVGTRDFYKVIKGGDKLEIQAFNLHGTLNLPMGNFNPKIRIPALKLPRRLMHVGREDESETTLVVTLNEGWQISFRIHNASSRVEPSLKFDINLVSAPHTLFTNHIALGTGIPLPT